MITYTNINAVRDSVGRSYKQTSFGGPPYVFVQLCRSLQKSLNVQHHSMQSLLAVLISSSQN